jgi:error-prone DNA polymerase
MGFYSPATLVQDARRHGIEVRPPCLLASEAKCRVESDQAIRLGLAAVAGLRASSMEALLSARRQGPFASVADLLRRAPLTPPERRALAESGALNGLAGDRRTALWRVEEPEWGELFAAAPTPAPPVASPLTPMTRLERVQADFRTLALTTGSHPMKLFRAQLPGVRTAAELSGIKPGTRVRVGGAVITRQRPGTAKGFCFITLEDETGHANAIVRPALFEKLRLVINLEPALLITGRLQAEEGVIHIQAEHIERLPELGLPAQASHDFR